jgi:hypothetical protein
VVAIEQITIDTGARRPKRVDFAVAPVDLPRSASWVGLLGSSPPCGSPRAKQVSSLVRILTKGMPLPYLLLSKRWFNARFQTAATRPMN